ncbi:hypothetical protein TRIUR3_09896 [Triticum urartu]|uniref:Uncharacterized protein n=1 Tax=Triticum urartu TaxID=4572 RepID=M7ZPE3_TRIUA|nr:hypothetical protein TRIUR3_09896 [Triticum urartu]
MKLVSLLADAALCWPVVAAPLPASCFLPGLHCCSAAAALLLHGHRRRKPLLLRSATRNQPAACRNAPSRLPLFLLQPVIAPCLQPLVTRLRADWIGAGVAESRWSGAQEGGGGQVVAVALALTAGAGMEEITRAERACMAGGWRLASSTEKRREWLAGLDEKLRNGEGELLDLDSTAVVGVLGGDVGVDLISHIQLESTSIVRMLAALSSIASWPSRSEAPRQVIFILDSGSLT